MLPEILPILAPFVRRADPPPPPPPPPDNTTTTTTTTTGIPGGGGGDPGGGGGAPGGGGGTGGGIPPSGSQNATSLPPSSLPPSSQPASSLPPSSSLPPVPPPQNSTGLLPTVSPSPSLTVISGTHTATVIVGVTVTPSASTTITAKVGSSTPKSFFQNTGEVAGVFSVVGLIGLGIIIFAITATMRRRRAKRWDREIAEAAREAATAPVPVFLDDEDDHYGPGPFSDHVNAPGYGGGNGFSDSGSYGTYAQSPMSHEMSERGYGGGYDPNAAYYGAAAAAATGVAAGAATGVAAGAAGIGVVRARSQRHPDAPPPGGDPYAAFATSAGMQSHPEYNNYARNTSPPPVQLPPSQWGGNNDGGYAVAAAIHGNNGGYPPPQHPHAAYANQPFASSYSNPSPGQMRSVSPPVAALNRGLSTKTGHSDGAHTSASGSGNSSQQPLTSPESYASHYTPAFDPSNYKPASNPHDIPSTDMLSDPTTETAVEDDAYGGYEDTSHGGLPNPFQSRGDSDDEDIGAYAIGGGSHDDHYGGGGRVLKVANAEVDDD